MEIEEKIRDIIKKFTKNDIWISIAESCTGGYVSHMITNISGASKVFERCIVSYGNQAKIDILKVNPKDIENYGAVSEEVARQMAYNVRIMSKQCDIGIGITGLAGPTGETPEKPIGLVYIGYSTIKETLVKKYNFKAERITFKKLILDEIIEFLENYSF